MKIGKEDFLVQVRYSDLNKGHKKVEEYFLGYGGELYIDPGEICHLDMRILNEIGSFSERERRKLRIHAPILEIDYSEPDHAFCEAKPFYEGTVRACEALGITNAVVHAEFNYVSAIPIEGQLKKAVIYWKKTCRLFGSHHIRIAIENHCETKPDHLIMLAKSLKEYSLGLCIDIGHVNAFSKTDIKSWLAAYPPGYLSEVHLADNEGDGDTHIPVGQGNADIAGFFDEYWKRRERSVFVLEPRTLDEARESICFLKKEGFLE